MRDRDIGLLEDVVRHGEEALAYLHGVTLEQFVKDRRLQLVTERLLEIIGEAAGGLSDEARKAVDVDWRAVRGLRNVLAHQYGAVDLPRLYRTAVNRLPPLIDAIRAVLR